MSILFALFGDDDAIEPSRVAFRGRGVVDCRNGTVAKDSFGVINPFNEVTGKLNLVELAGDGRPVDLNWSRNRSAARDIER